MHKKLYFYKLIAIIFIMCTVVLCSSTHDQINNGKEQTLYLFEIEEKYGYMNEFGNVVIKPVYDYASQFSEGLAVVGKENWLNNCKLGYINTSGKNVIKLSYTGAFSFNEGLTIVMKKKWGEEDWRIIDIDGKNVLNIDLYRINGLSEGLASVIREEGDNWTEFIDLKGNTKFIFNGVAECFSEGYAVVFTRNDKYGFIDKQGKIAIDTTYEEARNFREKVAPVKMNDKWGFINYDETIAIPFMYEDAYSFYEGVAAVKEDGLWGFINHDGEYVLLPQYFNVESCYNGLIMIKDQENNFLYYVDLDGKVIKPKIFY